MNLYEQLSDPAWNDERVQLEEAVLLAVTRLAVHSGACRMEIPRDGLKVIIEVSRRVQ